jgi:hypothetical protein
MMGCLVHERLNSLVGRVRACQSAGFGDETFRPFHGAPMQRRYRNGEWLPGHVFAEGLPVWASRFAAPCCRV